MAQNPLEASQIAAISDKYQEPTWLRDARSSAYETYENTPFPGPKDEQWRYTELNRFSIKDLQLVDAPVSEEVTARITSRIKESDAEGVIVHKANKVVYREADIKETGVIFTDLRTALAEHEDLVKEHLFSVIDASRGKYAALNQAIWENGTFLYVPAGVEVELPLGAFVSSDRGGLNAVRTLVVLEENANVTFLDEYTADEFGERFFIDAATELILGEGAKLRYVSLQNWPRTVAHINKVRAKVADGARLESLTVSLGADAARAEVECQLDGSGAESEMLGLYFADNGQHFDQYTEQYHAGPNAFSDLLFKGAIRHESNAVYSGIIRVEEDAQKTDAYQTNRNLLLDTESSAVSIPQLEIAANDVACSHGSTTSPVPEDQRFYLMSRGMRPEVAEHLLVTGFLYEVMGRVTLPKAVEYVERVVQAKLGVPGVKEFL